MGKQTNKYMFKTLLFLSIYLVLTTTFVFLVNLRTLNILKEEPRDIVVVNISTVSAQVYWKAPIQGDYSFFFKKLDQGEYTQGGGMEIINDEINNLRVYMVPLDQLEPESIYTFNIKSDNYTWDQQYTFSTKGINEELRLPEIVTGKDLDRSLLLVENVSGGYMLDTQYHGTYAFDSLGDDFKVTNYSRYITGKELGNRLVSFLPTPLYAATGANCKTNIEMNSSTVPTKAKVIDIIDRWVEVCPFGGYPETCYEDLFCKSTKYGINFGFATTIWAHESGGSNYAYKPAVEDFGIHGSSSIPVANFTKQADHFLQNTAKPGYISSCSWVSEFDKQFPNKTLSKEIIMWGARYSQGNCSSLDSLKKGYSYMQGINKYYGWFTNQELKWPFTALAYSSTCDYSNAKTNTAYNSCNKKGASNSPTPPGEPTPPEGGDCGKDWMAITGVGDNGQRISPEVNRTCPDIDGCICIWNYNVSGEYTKEVSVGQTCNVDGSINKSPADPQPPPESDPQEPEPGEDSDDIIDDPRCGSRSKTYLSSETTWPADSELCTIGTPTPSDVQFPVAGQTVRWECVNGPVSNECSATVRLASDTTPLCGRRSGEFPPTMTDWQPNTTLCEVGTPTPSTVAFPANEATASWQCINGTDSVNCTATTKLNVDFNTVCCLDNQAVYITKPENCLGKKLENVSASMCVSTNSTLSIKQGVNFYKALEVINDQEVPITSAKELITYSGNKILTVGVFRNDRWEKLVKYENSIINGEDFSLDSSEVYMIISTQDLEIPVKIVVANDISLDLSNLVGWNLIPSNLLQKKASDTTGILTHTELQYINQIGIWDSHFARFDYTIRDDSGSMFGESYKLDQQSGIFIKVPK